MGESLVVRRAEALYFSNMFNKNRVGHAGFQDIWDARGMVKEIVVPRPLLLFT